MSKKKEKGIWEEDFSLEPMLSATKGVAKKLADTVFPTEKEKLERARKRLDSLKARIEAKRLEIEYAKKLKELEEIEKEVK